VLGTDSSTGGAAPGEVEHADPATASASPATATVTRPRLRIIAAQITVANPIAERVPGSWASAPSRVLGRVGGTLPSAARVPGRISVRCGAYATSSSATPI